MHSFSFRALRLCERMLHKHKYAVARRRALNLSDYLDEIETSANTTFPWPGNKKAAFSLSIDDISLCDGKNGALDFGGDIKGIAWTEFDRLLKQIPELKVTLFFVPNPHFHIFELAQNKATKCDYSVVGAENHPVLLKLKVLKERVETAQHGYSHFEKRYFRFLPCQEFEFLSEEEALQRCQKGHDEMTQVGFPPQGFKPPAWSIGRSKNFGLLKALEQMDYGYVCLSTPNNGLNYEQQTVSHFVPEKTDYGLNLPQNLNMNFELADLKQIAQSLIDKGGFLHPQFHFVENGPWMSDGLCQAMTDKLCRLIEFCDTYSQGSIWYGKLDDVSEFTHGNFTDNTNNEFDNDTNL